MVRVAVWASSGATIRGDVLPGKAKQLMTDNGTAQAVLQRVNHGVTGWAWKHHPRPHRAGGRGRHG